MLKSKQFSASRFRQRAGYTIAELLVLIAAIAIGVAVIVEFKRMFTPRFIEAISVTADGSQLLTAQNDGAVIAWDATTGQQTLLRKSQSTFYAPPAFSPSGQLMASVEWQTQPQEADDSVLIIDDLKTGQRDDCGPINFYGASLSSIIAFSDDDQHLAVVDEAANKVRVFNPRDPNDAGIVLQPIDPAAGAGSSPLRSSHLAFSSDGLKLFLLGYDGQLARWDLATRTAKRINLAAAAPVSPATCFAVSPDGKKLAISKFNISGSNFSTDIDLYDADTLALLNRTTLTQQVGGIGFYDGGKQLAIEANGTLELRDAENLRLVQRQVNNYFSSQFATNTAATRLGMSDWESVYVLDGGNARRLGGVGTAGISLTYLIIAFVVVFGLFRLMRKRRKMNMCVDCGKRWQEAKRRSKTTQKQCPQCRLDHLPTGELRKRLGTGAPLPRVLSLLAILVFVTAWLFADWYPHTAIGFLAAVVICAAGIVAMFVALVYLLALKHRVLLRRLNRFEPTLARAQKIAGSEGQTEQVGELTVWTDWQKPSVNEPNVYSVPAAEEISMQLADCRRQLEVFTGQACPPLPPSQMYIFETTSAAQKFIPTRGLTNDMPAVFCGPWANVGCISIEGMQKQLRPLSASIRALLTYQSAPMSKFGFWLGYGFYNFIGRMDDPAAGDATRRRIAAWAAERSLLPLAEMSRRRLVSTLGGGAKASLPENYTRRLKILNQWISIVDYLCGDEATPARREEFKRIWETSARKRKFADAVQEACGCSLAEFAARWKDWAATARFSAPPIPPAEIAEFAEREIIPLVRNSAAPIQRRIKAIRILGNSGWSIGAEVLLEMFADPQPDVQLEALAALRQLSGRLGTERPDDWYEWLHQLKPTPVPATV